MKSQVEHPGVKIFQTNKKILKAKAYDELEKNLEDINDRKLVILETIIGLKDKVSKDVSKVRLHSALKTTTHRAELKCKRKAKQFVTEIS